MGTIWINIRNLEQRDEDSLIDEEYRSSMLSASIKLDRLILAI